MEERKPGPEPDLLRRFLAKLLAVPKREVEALEARRAKRTKRKRS